VTGHRGGDLTARHRRWRPVTAVQIGDGQRDGLAAVPVEQRRHGGDAKTRAAEVLDFETQASEFARMLEQRLVLARRQLHHHRRQQPLRIQRPAGQPLGNLLEQNPLVRYVLVDDGNPRRRPPGWCVPELPRGVIGRMRCPTASRPGRAGAVARGLLADRPDSGDAGRTCGRRTAGPAAPQRVAADSPEPDEADDGSGSAPCWAGRASRRPASGRARVRRWRERVDDRRRSLVDQP
jgi:hypothetical protein